MESILSFLRYIDELNTQFLLFILNYYISGYVLGVIYHSYIQYKDWKYHNRKVTTQYILFPFVVSFLWFISMPFIIYGRWIKRGKKWNILK